jgi:hypothetical protein
MSDTPKVKRMIPYTQHWERLANARARDYVSLYPCVDCGGPVIWGYCCTRCGSTNPEGAK